MYNPANPTDVQMHEASILREAIVTPQKCIIVRRATLALWFHKQIPPTPEPELLS